MALALFEDFKNLIAKGKTDIEEFLSHRGPELEKLAALAESVDADPLMQAAQAAIGLTPGMRQGFAELIAKADAELTALVQQATENGRQAGHAAALAEVAPPPAEGEQPAEVQPAE